MSKITIELEQTEFDTISKALEIINTLGGRKWLESKIVSKKKSLEFKYVKEMNSITMFGDKSIAHVKIQEDLIFIMRDCDNEILAIGNNDLLKYKDCDIRTMYTGVCHGTGDYTLIADTQLGQEEIYRWRIPSNINLNDNPKFIDGDHLIST